MLKSSREFFHPAFIFSKIRHIRGVIFQILCVSHIRVFKNNVFNKQSQSPCSLWADIRTNNKARSSASGEHPGSTLSPVVPGSSIPSYKRTRTCQHSWSMPNLLILSLGVGSRNWWRKQEGILSVLRWIQSCTGMKKMNNYLFFFQDSSDFTSYWNPCFNSLIQMLIGANREDKFRWGSIFAWLKTQTEWFGVGLKMRNRVLNLYLRSTSDTKRQRGFLPNMKRGLI